MSAINLKTVKKKKYNPNKTEEKGMTVLASHSISHFISRPIQSIEVHDWAPKHWRYHLFHLSASLHVVGDH